MQAPDPEAAGVPVKARASLAAEQAREPGLAVPGLAVAGLAVVGLEWVLERAVALAAAGVPAVAVALGLAKGPVPEKEWARVKAPAVGRVPVKVGSRVRAERERAVAAANPAVFCSSNWK